MIRTILSIALLVGLGTTVTVNADPSPTPSNKKVQKQAARTSRAKTMKTAEIVPAPALKEGWSRVNGTWVHSDGYKLVNGQVVRVGTQTHKKPPKPPTKAEMEAATRNARSPSPADAAAQKAAERERNLTPRPAPQTGTHL
ncbi:MAG TPA: hypothetical protein VGH00_03375 [Chthoniobacterales bacterium]